MKSKIQTMNKTNRVYSAPFIIQEKKVIQDENGIEKEKWTNKYKLYGDIKNLHGSEYELAKQVNNSKTIKIIIQQGPQINEDMRVLFNNKTYDIDNIDNISYQDEELEIKAIERVFKNE